MVKRRPLSMSRCARIDRSLAELAHPAITLINRTPSRSVHKLRTTTLRPESMLSLKAATPRRRVCLTVRRRVAFAPTRHVFRHRRPAHITPAPSRIRRLPVAGLTPIAILVVAAPTIPAREALRLPRNCATLPPAPHHLPAIDAGNIGFTSHANLRASKSPPSRRGEIGADMSHDKPGILFNLWKSMQSGASASVDHGGVSVCREVRSRAGADRLPPGGASDLGGYSRWGGGAQQPPALLDVWVCTPGSPVMHAFTIRCLFRVLLFWVVERLGCVRCLCVGCTIGISRLCSRVCLFRPCCKGLCDRLLRCLVFASIRSRVRLRRKRSV